MRVALIPPRGLENFALQSNIHLMLAIPHLLRRGAYSSLYKRAKRLGAHVILDNGAAEKEPAPWRYLLEQAHEYDVDEVVAPDELYDSSGTITVVKGFLQQMRKSFPQGLNLVAVAQGKTPNEYKACVRALADIPEIKTVGVPRDMINTTGNRTARIDFARWLSGTFPGRFNIHFLGANSAWPQEVKAAAKYLDRIVRSVDTSLPFNYALSGAHLSTDKNWTPPNIQRPDKYFEKDWNGKCDLDIVRHNVKTFLDWAQPPAPEEDE